MVKQVWLVVCLTLIFSHCLNADVVIEKIDGNSILGKAGLMSEDVVISWKSARAARSASPTGRISTIFDWLWMKEEYGSRDSIILNTKRRGIPRKLFIRPGKWEGEVRPVLSYSSEVLYDKGTDLIKQGDIDGGVAVWYELENKIANQGNHNTACWLLLKIGRTWTERKHAEDAAKPIRKALALASTKMERSLIWYSLGGLYWDLSDFKSSGLAYQRAVDLQNRKSGTLFFAAAMSSLGSSLWQIGKVRDMELYSLRALKIRERLAPESYLVVESLNNLSIFYWTRGEMGLAGTYLRRAILIQNNLEPQGLTSAGLLSNLGLVYWRLNELKEAEGCLDESLAIREKLAPGSEGLADTLNNLGNVARSTGNLYKAEDYRKKALEIQMQLAPEGLKVADILNNLGNLRADLNDYDAAEKFYQDALRIRQKIIPESVATAVSIYSIGHLLLDRHEYEKGLPFLIEALRLYRKLAPGSDSEAEALFALGQTYRAKNQPDLALPYFLDTLEMIEAQEELLGEGESSQAMFRERYWKIYRETIEAMLEWNTPQEAFLVMERGRARSFLAMLGERNLTVGNKLPKSVKAKQERLTRSRNRLRHEISALGSLDDSNQGILLKVRLRDVEEDLEKLNDSVRRKSLPGLVRRFSPIDVGVLAGALDEGTLVLCYSIGKATSDLFAIDHSGLVRVARLGLGYEDLYGKVDLFRKLIAGVGVGRESEERREGIARVGRDLYADLLGPMDDLISSSKRLLIVPDVPVHSLPWGVLVRNKEDGVFLANWKPFHLALSGTAYAELVRNRKEQPRSDDRRLDLVAFGDALYSTEKNNNVTGVGKEAGAGSLAIKDRVSRWNSLPGSRIEVEEISKMFAENSRIYLGAEATEEHAKTAIKNAKIIHFATHAFVDSEAPLNSGIVLSIPRKPGREDGVLQAWEILEQIQLDSDLVVLSACESGLGEEAGAEGLSSLARAFQIAGARTVLASNWKVSDAATVNLMVHFYKHLKEGQSKDVALQTAQAELIREARLITVGEEEGIDTSDPFFWATFQIYGDWR